MQCAICGADAWYVCGRSGRPVCPQHSRVEIVSKLSFGQAGSLSVREATSEDYARVGELADYFWGKSTTVRFDKEYDILDLPAYVVSANGNLSGVLSYALEPESLAIITLDVLPGYQGLGGGKMLLEAVKEKAAAENRKSVLVTASNDDLPAIYLYQKNGFRIYDVKPDVLDEHHFGFQVGFAGIPCKDEIRLRLDL